MEVCVVDIKQFVEELEFEQKEEVAGAGCVACAACAACIACAACAWCCGCVFPPVLAAALSAATVATLGSIATGVASASAGVALTVGGASF